MWALERTEGWANLSGCGGSKSYHVCRIDLPEKPKAADIRKKVNEALAEHGFRVDDLDLSLRSAGVIMGGLKRTEPESRVLDEFHSDTFSMMCY